MKNILTLKIYFQKGMGRSLLLLLLVSALLPMILVSWFHYQSGKEILKEQANRYLKEVMDGQAKQLNDYFGRMIAQITMLSEMHQNVHFLNELTKGFSESNRDLGQFVQSYDWSLLAEKGKDLTLFRRTFAIHDIYLLDNNGNILYSVVQQDDLGTNVFTGPEANSGFAKACRNTNASGKVSFADYQRYTITSETDAYAFFTAPIIDADGAKLGILAFQIAGSDIDSMMNHSFGTKGEVFLISEGGRRSTSKLDPSRKFLAPLEETEQVRRWREHLRSTDAKDADDLRKSEGIIAYIGSLGNPVFGMHYSLQVLDTPFAIIAEADQQDTLALINKLQRTVFTLAIATGLLVIILASFHASTLVEPILQLVELTKKVAAGNYEGSEEIQAKHELADLAANFQLMQTSLRETSAREKRDDWQKIGVAGLNDTLRGEQELTTLAGRVTAYLAEYLQAQVGAFYLHDKDAFVYCAGYACKMRNQEATCYSAGEGLIGQAGHTKKSIHYTDLPKEHLALSINSGLGESAPGAILAVPLIYGGHVLGVFELGRISPFSQEEIRFLEDTAFSVAIAINTALSRNRTNELLAKTQRLSQELQNQQEELRASNEELEEQTVELQRSKKLLQEQSEELRASNEELQEKTESLQLQKREISLAKDEVDKKARDLASASRYKSEFLANMSHELRSPLNSLLILARSLADNDEGNLTKEQVEEARIIHDSGTDLLHLINDILDLSKVEAGQLDIHRDTISLESFCHRLGTGFARQAEKKGLDFRVQCDQGLPEILESDEQRLGQILKNLISNALKFTAKGEVVLEVRPADADTISFAVRDTGIGVAPEKQQAIFEAFQQADGSTMRKYGGTGLGLTISRQLAILLGGSIEVQSQEGKGSIFTVLLPTKMPESVALPADKGRQEIVRAEPVMQEPPPDATHRSEQTPAGLAGKTILVVDDDMRNTFALGNLLKKAGMQAILAASGDQAMEHLRKNPDIALVIMDMMLPQMGGYEAIAHIRDMQEYKDLPIIALTAKAMGDDREKCLAAGANDYLPKPVDRQRLFAMLSGILT